MGFIGSNKNLMPSSNRFAFVLFCYKNRKLVEKLIDFLDQPESLILIHWDADSLQSTEFECSRAELLELTPRVSISWGGAGIVRVQEQVLRFLYNVEFSHVLFLTEDSIPLMGYDDIVSELAKSREESIEVARPTQPPSFSLVNFLPKNSHRNKTLLASIDFRLSLLAPKLSAGGNLWRGRAWLALSKYHATLMVDKEFCMERRERVWLQRWVLLSEEYFLQTALHRLVEQGFGAVRGYRLVHAEYRYTNPSLLQEEDLRRAKRNKCLFARKADIELWGKIEVIWNE